MSSGCASVIMGDVIVDSRIRNGNGSCTNLKTVEYYVIGEIAWKELPAMNQAWATACVYHVCRFTSTVDHEPC